jgi:hypothetical protein
MLSSEASLSQDKMAGVVLEKEGSECHIEI